MTFKLALSGASFAFLIASVAHGADLERWACREPEGQNTTWTIADNRMFVATGKGALQVVENTPSLTMAYRLSLTSDRNTVISYVYVLDKTSGRLLVYDDMIPAIWKGLSGDPFEPKVTVSSCSRLPK